MKRAISLLVLCVLGLSLALTPASAAGETATGQIVSTTGANLGTVTLTQDASGMVMVTVNFNSMPVGTHGIHFHQVGKCEAPFTSAGEHFNPEGKKHGLDNPDGAHAGDLENLTVPASGSGTYQSMTDRITLAAGPKSIFDADGTALIIHENADDQKTDPSGNSGGRVACAVLTLSASNAPSVPGAAPSTGAGATQTGDISPLVVILPLALVAIVAAGLLFAFRRRTSARR